MRKRLYIYGAGGQGRETRLWVERAGLLDDGMYSWAGFVVTDESFRQDGTTSDGVECYEDWLVEREERMAVVLGLGDPRARVAIGKRLSQVGHLEFPSVIDPTAVIDPNLNFVGKGVVIAPGCTITVGVHLSHFVHLNYQCTVGHDTRIEEGCQVNPGARISGNVAVGEGSLIGAGATILEAKRIGAYCTIGAGAVVTRDVPAGVVVAGVPAKPTG